MARTANIPGYQLRSGDVIHHYGYRWKVATHPELKILATGSVLWYIQVDALDTVPPGYDHMVFSGDRHAEWLVEF